MKSTKFTKTLYMVSVLLFSFACQPKQPDGNIYFTEDDLPVAIDLKGEKYSFSKIINPKGVFLKNGLAIVYEIKNVADDKFHIIDLKTSTYIQSKGIDGLGPGELTSVYAIDDSEEENKIWVYDYEQRTYFKYDLKDSSKLAEEQIKTPSTEYFINYAAMNSNNTIIANLVDGWTKYLNITLDGDTVSTFGNWKDMIENKEFPRGVKGEDLDANLISNLFQGPIKASQDKKHFIKAGTIVDYIDIINPEKQEIKTIFGPSQEIQDFELAYWDGYQMPAFTPAKTTRYSDAFAGNNSFFVLFDGKPFSQISSPDNLNRIFEFDYEGNILNQYQLDYPIHGIAVDEESRAIYGVTVDREPNLVRFDY